MPNRAPDTADHGPEDMNAAEWLAYLHWLRDFYATLPLRNRLAPDVLTRTYYARNMSPFAAARHYATYGTQEHVN